MKIKEAPFSSQRAALPNFLDKGWCDEFETGLNIIVAIVQKV